MRQRQGKERVKDLLQAAPDGLHPRPWGIIQTPPGRGVSLDQPLEAAGHVQEDGLRTSPPAPHPAEHRREIEEAEPRTRYEKETEPKVLRHQGQPKEMEVAIGDVQEHRRVVVDRYPGQGGINAQEEYAGYGSQRVEPASRDRRMDESPRPIRVDGGRGLEAGRGGNHQFEAVEGGDGAGAALGG